MLQEINDFRGEYAFLSNFSPAQIMMGGMLFPTSEHAYQAAKSLDKEYRQCIQSLRTPGQAKREGKIDKRTQKVGPKQVDLRGDWWEINIEVMRQIVRQKFKHSDLRKKLLATGDAYLREGNTWNDRFWGCVWENGEWVGENWLGKILMEIREEIRKEIKSGKA